MFSKISFIQLGKFKSLAYEELFLDYYKRLGWFTKVDLKEIKISKDDPFHVNSIIEKLLVVLKGTHLLVLSEHGKEMDSLAFSNYVEKKEGALSVIVGTSWGLPLAVTQKADFVLSLGKMTFPHEAARVLIAEQLYRAYTIIKKENYHK